MKLIKWLLGSLLILLLLTASWIAWDIYDPRRHIIGYSVYGIDVSKWQPKIDWMRAKRDGLTFVFIKATEGVDLVDPKYQEYTHESMQAGFIQGVYHYYLPRQNPIAQAKHFCQTVKLSEGNLPPVIDLEEMVGKDREGFEKNLQIFIDSVEIHFKVQPILYASRNYYVAFLKEKFSQYPLWIANYQKRPEDSTEDIGKEWLFWQFSNTGRVKGIEGNVDLNVFSGSYTDLYKWCLK